MYFVVNDIDLSDYVSGMKVGYETLVSDTGSGRNANGDMIISVISQKKKVYITFRHTTDVEMRKILSAISPYEITVKFLNPLTNRLETIAAYTGTPEPEYYTISDKTIFKPMSLNFIEK